MSHHYDEEARRKSRGIRLGLPLRWMAKKQLASLIDCYRGAPAEGADQCLRLLRRYPKLAHGRYERRVKYLVSGGIHPLAFVLEMGAGLEIAREVHEMYPPAVREAVYISSMGRPDFPLHLACQLGRVPPEVIQFLAHAAPKVVAYKDSFRHFPLHSILRNSFRSATVAEVETLLDIYPAAIDQDCGAGTPPVVSLKSSHATKDVLELLMHRFSSHCGEFRLPTRDIVKTVDGVRYIEGYDRIHIITLAHAEALAILLQYDSIRTFSCLPKRWHRDAFLSLMKCLKEARFLLDLSLHVPPSLFCVDGKSDEEVCCSLQRLLEENTMLECLHIDFGYEQRVLGAPKAAQKCLRALTLGLCANRSLRECYLSGSILTQSNDILEVLKKQEVVRKELWAPLADSVRKANSSLEWISLEMMPLANRQELSKEALRVQYWTALNRCGRAQVRNPDFSILDLVELITKANQKERLVDFVVGITYGLLQECPGLWSSSALQYCKLSRIAVPVPAAYEER